MNTPIKVLAALVAVVAAGYLAPARAQALEACDFMQNDVYKIPLDHVGFVIQADECRLFGGKYVGKGACDDGGERRLAFRCE